MKLKIFCEQLNHILQHFLDNTNSSTQSPYHENICETLTHFITTFHDLDVTFNNKNTFRIEALIENIKNNLYYCQESGLNYQAIEYVFNEVNVLLSNINNEIRPQHINQEEYAMLDALERFSISKNTASNPTAMNGTFTQQLPHNTARFFPTNNNYSGNNYYSSDHNNNEQQAFNHFCNGR